MSKTALTLVLPNLAAALAPFPQLKLPALQRLLAYAHKTHYPMQEEVLLFDLFNLNTKDDLPIAAVTAWADGLPAQNGYWLRADLVEFRADFTAVYLLGNQHFEISSTQRHALAQQINDFLLTENLKFFLPHPQRGYLQLSQAPALHTYPLSQVVGNNINDYMPHGAQATYWRKLMTELQMLLFNIGNPLAANGVWLWGEGALPVKLTTPWQAVWSNEPISHGLAKLSGNYAGAINTEFQYLLQQLKPGENYLFVYTLSHVTKNNADDLSRLDQKIFLPLLTALREKLIDEVTIYSGDEHRYQITKPASWQIWRKL